MYDGWQIIRTLHKSITNIFSWGGRKIPFHQILRQILKQKVRKTDLLTSSSMPHFSGSQGNAGWSWEQMSTSNRFDKTSSAYWHRCCQDGKKVNRNCVTQVEWLMRRPILDWQTIRGLHGQVKYDSHFLEDAGLQSFRYQIRTGHLSKRKNIY